MKAGVIELYFSFLDHLRAQRDTVAVLQLSGKIEDYLSKHFIYHVYRSTGGARFALTNLGKRGERRIDICLIKGRSTKNPRIYGLIEAKYLRNKSRIHEDGATDEIYISLKRLSEQLGALKSLRHGGYEVQLSALSKNIYGLPFASYVTKGKNEEEKKRFYEMILRKAGKFFRYHDKDKPILNPVIDDVHVRLLNADFYVSLKAGLWRTK